jgi:hypothetical protein
MADGDLKYPIICILVAPSFSIEIVYYNQASFNYG